MGMVNLDQLRLPSPKFDVSSPHTSSKEINSLGNSVNDKYSDRKSIQQRLMNSHTRSVLSVERREGGRVVRIDRSHPLVRFDQTTKRDSENN
jgi:hypothetical protein